MAVSVLLVGGVAAAYQLGARSRRPPSFSAGGRFRSVDDLPVAGRGGRPLPYGDAPTAPPSAAAQPAPAADAPTTTPGTASRPAVVAAGTTTTTVPPVTTTAAPPPSRPPVPALGSYTYAVEGTESSTGFGSRAFPTSVGVVVHGDAGIGPDDRVHDVRMSAQHEERTIARYGPGGISLVYEAGSITFGPVTQTSAGTYAPAMVQVPWPLSEGASASGASTAVDASGNAMRVEHWTATVTGREQLHVLGRPHETWVVEVHRTTDAGGAEQVDRTRRSWYDPALGTWVRWTERFHGSRSLLVDFSYDAQYTAELTSFVPA